MKNGNKIVLITGVSGGIRVTDLLGVDYNITNSTGWPKNGFIKINYTESGHYTLNITAVDKAGNPATTSINVTVYATEEQVDSIATAIYGPLGFSLNYRCHCHPAAAAYPCNTIFLIIPFKSMIKSYDYPCTAYPGRVPQCDRTAVHVQFLPVPL